MNVDVIEERKTHFCLGSDPWSDSGSGLRATGRNKQLIWGEWKWGLRAEGWVMKGWELLWWPSPRQPVYSKHLERAHSSVIACRTASRRRPPRPVWRHHATTSQPNTYTAESSCSSNYKHFNQRLHVSEQHFRFKFISTMYWVFK